MTARIQFVSSDERMPSRTSAPAPAISKQRNTIRVRGCQVSKFIIRYHLHEKSSSKLLSPAVLEALDFPVQRLETFETKAEGYIAVLTTSNRHRIETLRRKFTAEAYNEVGHGGVRIHGGEGGLKIFSRSKNDAACDEYGACMRLIRYIRSSLGAHMGACVGVWMAAANHDSGTTEEVSCRTSTGTSSRRVMARREDALAQQLQAWADTHQLPMLWTQRDRENPEAERVQCGAFRVDFTYELDDQRVVLLEYDEHAHGTYSLDCELKRQVQLAVSFGGRPVHFIRFNPDGDGDSLPLLLERLQTAMAPAPTDDSHFGHFLVIEYLFYPRIAEGGCDGPVQTFRFKTVNAYEQWAVLRTMGMPLMGAPVFSDAAGGGVNVGDGVMDAADLVERLKRSVSDKRELERQLEIAEARVRELSSAEARVRELEWQLAAERGA